MAQVRLKMGDCPQHGPSCTILGFTSVDDSVGALTHLTADAVRTLHQRLGERVIALDVPRVAHPSSPEPD